MEPAAEVSTKACSTCGVAVPAGSPLAQCAACLVRLGLDAARSRRGSSTASAILPVEVVAGWFPDLEVESILGRGGMGTVYNARQSVLNRSVALKIVPFEQARELVAPERLMREAQLLAQLTHPRIVTLYEVRQFDDHFCLLMELIEGGNLRLKLLGGPLPVDEVTRIAEEICEGVAFAHSRGVMHRDIKPENILLDTDGSVRIADFGLAKLIHTNAASSLPMTRTGQIVGSINYVAPEQVEGTGPVDQRADLYAVGVVLYEMLVGKHPAVDYQPPSSLRKLDRRFDRLVQRLLRRDPEQRYSSAESVIQELRRIRTTRDRRATVRVLSLGTAVVGLGIGLAQLFSGTSTGKVNATSARGDLGAQLSEIHAVLHQSFVDLKNPTATAEENNEEFSIRATIDGIGHSGGWSLAGRDDENQSAVFQTVSPLSAEELVIALRNDGGGFPGYKPQRFRISYTTNPDPKIGDPSIQWIRLKPVQVDTARADTTSTIDADGATIEISGSSKVPDDYTIVIREKLEGVTGFRLDLLLGKNKRLGFGGPMGCNVHVSEFEVLSYPPPQPALDPQPVELVRAVSSFQQIGTHLVTELIDGHERGGSYWIINSGNQLEDQFAVVYPRAPVTSASLIFELMHNTSFWNEKMHRFRLSYSTDPSVVTSPEKAEWIPIIPGEVRFDPPGLSATIEPSGTIVIHDGERVAQCNYLISANQSFHEVRAFRLDVLTGERGTLGHAIDDGRMLLSEWKVLVPQQPK